MSMAEATAVLESSPAEIITAMEAARGPLVNLTPEERKEYRTTGELPKPKTEASAASSASAGVSETPSQQEKPKNEPKPKQTAEERIAQLEATIEKIRKGSGAEKPKAESAPAKPETANARPTPDDKATDGSPKFKTHEEYEEAVIDWKLEQRDAKKAADVDEEKRLEDLNAKVEKARSRHGDIDKVIQVTAKDILEDTSISPVAKNLIGKSEYVADLLFTIGGDPKELANFKKMSTEDAIRYLVLTESLIAQELAEPKPAVETVEPPAKPRTQAPRPPAEAGGRAATPPDSLQAALEGSGGKLVPSLKAEFLRRDLARLNG